MAEDIHYITHTDNHTIIAKDYLLEQYKNKPNINGLLTAIIDPLQDIENKLYEIYRNYSLAEASSYYLDRIGAIIGESRDYREDHEYKLAILVRIISNNGGATPEEIILVLRSIYSIDSIHYSESGSAYFQICIKAASKPKGINQLLYRLKPAAVAIPSIIYISHDDLFRFTEVESEYDYDNSAYAELIISKYNINLDDDSHYLVKKQTPLNAIYNTGDFTISGGKPFAEIIMNE